MFLPKTRSSFSAIARVSYNSDENDYVSLKHMNKHDTRREKSIVIP